MMAKRDETEREVRHMQRASKQLAKDEAPPKDAWQPAHETATVAVRLRVDVINAIAQLARDRGVNQSTLIREWIMDGIVNDPPPSIHQALTEFDRAYAQLRQSIQPQRP